MNQTLWAAAFVLAAAGLQPFAAESLQFELDG